jgi:hypothetical protein
MVSSFVYTSVLRGSFLFSIVMIFIQLIHCVLCISSYNFLELGHAKMVSVLNESSAAIRLYMSWEEIPFAVLRAVK